MDQLIPLAECEKYVKHLLALAKEITCHVYIVTNAVQGWVEALIGRFYPTLSADGTFENIIIISARSQYACTHIGQPAMWKYCVMHGIISNVNLSISKEQIHIISVGDSMYDLEAARTLYTMHQDTTLKTVKTIHRPESCEHLQVQTRLIIEWVKYITGTGTEINRHFDLWASVESVDGFLCATMCDTYTDILLQPTAPI